MKNPVKRRNPFAVSARFRHAGPMKEKKEDETNVEVELEEHGVELGFRGQLREVPVKGKEDPTEDAQEAEVAKEVDASKSTNKAEEK